MFNFTVSIVITPLLQVCVCFYVCVCVGGGGVAFRRGGRKERVRVKECMSYGGLNPGPDTC